MYRKSYVLLLVNFEFYQSNNKLAIMFRNVTLYHFFWFIYFTKMQNNLITKIKKVKAKNNVASILNNCVPYISTESGKYNIN